MYAPGLPTVVRRARPPATLPVPFDVVCARGPGADASIADSSETVAHVDGSRTKRRHRGVRSGTAEQAGLATCNPPPYLLATCTFPPKMEVYRYARTISGRACCVAGADGGGRMLVAAVGDVAVGDLRVGGDHAWNAGYERHAGYAEHAGGHQRRDDGAGGSGGRRYHQHRQLRVRTCDADRPRG